MARCECGRADGAEACDWQGPVGQTVVVEYMPAYLRASHRAAGNYGWYPHNGAVRLTVSRACAAAMCDSEDPADCGVVGA